MEPVDPSVNIALDIALEDYICMSVCCASLLSSEVSCRIARPTGGKSPDLQDCC